MTESARVARAIKRAFVTYRINMAIARDPEERPAVKDAAWSRAANARARIDRQLSIMEGAA